ncbi:hypothetical protein SBC1_60980 (plasmid) [Caballeronia sp. SBC1]|uniref:hypothetical protein n=1 Tax=unclassified Caballeronia TaxID=2646786 RepID=UPI0013E133FD|nr:MULTISPECIES: hypothetical protein [unclassified Caballeronia]QIE27986.1 hypothetical protein SBC2_60610 [Caballeronia sp. SBC2]QIN66052.1 hypothetical protein SBC1_60980 [Caballeronia sp. SBC1]
MPKLNDPPGGIDAIVNDDAMLTSNLKGFCLTLPNDSARPLAKPGAKASSKTAR